MDLSEIQYFYKNKTILLTGATGFVGKLVLEKILRTLPVKHVYVLMRAKDGKDAESRCADIFDSAAFGPVKRNEEDFFKKVSLILGDLEKPDLDISEYDRNLIKNEVHFIFHCAAATKFDENLKTVIWTNVRATKELLEISKETTNLEAFVYLSSVYSNFPKYEIHEQFYEPTTNAEQIIALCDTVRDDKLPSMEKKILGEWPNAYLYSLSVTEDLLKTEGKGLPISIVRPSMVLPSNEEPITGFVDKSFGLVEHSVAHAMGINRVNYFKKGTLDVIPVDFVVSLMIASGWYIGLQQLRMKRGAKITVDTAIYHCISSHEKPINSEEWMGMIHTSFKEVPTSRMIQLPTSVNTACYYNYKLLTFILHYCMAFLCDTGLKLLGKGPVVVDMYRRFHHSQELFSPFLFKEWYFDNDNTQKLLKRMTFQDRELFKFDIFDLNWQSYFVTYARGVRVYLLNDPMSTLAEGRKKQQKKLVVQLVSAAFLVAILYFIAKILVVKVLF